MTAKVANSFTVDSRFCGLVDIMSSHRSPRYTA